jgi:ADP-heptose:LPS heptosyltransferase
MEPNGKVRVVLARPDRIGDVVISTSCIAPVRAALPDAEIHFVAQARMESLFNAHPALKSFIPLPPSGDSDWRIEALAAHFRKIKPDCIVHLHSDPEIECAAAKAEIPRRIGFTQNGGEWLTDALPEPKKRGDKHEALYNFDLLEMLGVAPPAELAPCLNPNESALDRLVEKLPEGITAGRYAVLHVGAHGDKPRIAPEFFIAIARWLVKERKLYVVLIGAEAGDETAAEIMRASGSASSWIHDFCGETDLAEAAFLLRDAAVVFGRDSGPAHLAAAMGAHTVTLMLEPEYENSSRRWRPLGARSWVLEKPLKRGWFESRPGFARRNLSQFTPEEIISALQAALDA